MEKTAVGRKAGFRGIPIGRCAAVVVGWCMLGPAWADDAAQQPQDLLLAEARIDQPVQLEVNASTLPRLDSQDNGFQSPRLDMALMPATGGGLGVAVGMSGFSPASTLLPSGYAALRPSVDLGLTWRHTLQGHKQIDVTAWRRMSPEQDAYTLVQMRQPVYGARVELKLTPVRKAGLSFDRGIGLQLQSGAKISIKRRHGGPMIYYRTTF